MYPQDQNNFYSNSRNNNSPNNLRMKKRFYTIIQIVAVIGLIISLPMLILGIINAVPHFGQDAKTTGVITKISDDFGAIIDKSTDGKTALSNGCNISYDFNNGSKGLSHSTKYCDSAIGDKIPINYNPSNPSSNSITTDYSFYAILFWFGIVLMVASLSIIIVMAASKRRIINAQRYGY